jgi:hypothetical protein
MRDQARWRLIMVFNEAVRLLGARFLPVLNRGVRWSA